MDLELLSRKRLEFYQSQAIDLIVAPWGFGGTDNLAQEGAHSFLEKDIVKKLEAVGAKVNLIEEEGIGPFQLSEKAKRIKNIEAINQINSWLAKRVETSSKEKNIAITLGGDASLSIATVAGLANAKKNFAVLWISNHLSNSSPEVTKSWNANRMAFTALSFDGQKKDLHKDMQTLRSISKLNPMLNKDKVIHLGVGHKSAQINVEHTFFTMSDVSEYGISKIIKYSIEDLLSKADELHVIWDLNSLDLSGVSNYLLGQLSYREALVIARELDVLVRRKGKLSSIDIVEHCPSREAWDKRGEAATWVNDILATVFGETIFNCLRKY